MTTEQILTGVQAVLDQAAVTGEKLNGTTIARRIGCSRTVLYTNDDVRAILLQHGIIDDAPPVKRPTKDPQSESDTPRQASVAERRLQKAEERANRLEQLLAEAQEHIRTLQAENESLRLRNRLLMEGKAVL